MAKNKSNLQIDPKQPIFLGIDVHKNKWSLCFIHQDEIVGKFTIESEFSSLEKLLKRYESNEIFSAYETGFSGFFLHYKLKNIGVKNIVVAPNKIPIKCGDLVKTDNYTVCPSLKDVCCSAKTPKNSCREGQGRCQDSFYDSYGLHRFVSLYFHKRLTSMKLIVPVPEGAFYVMPDFSAYRETLRKKGITTSDQLAEYLLEELHIAVLPGTDFEMHPATLTIRIATVDYDGEAALKSLKFNPGLLKAEMSRKRFLKRHFSKSQEGLDRLEQWLNSLE